MCTDSEDLLVGFHKNQQIRALVHTKIIRINDCEEGGISITLYRRKGSCELCLKN